MGNQVEKISTCFGKNDSETDTPGLPSVQFGLHGPECIVDGLRVNGKGSALAGASLMQDRAYWEIKVCGKGPFAFGVARRQVHKLPSLGYDENSWALRSDQFDLQNGDILGCAFDQGDVPTQLRFYHNGVYLESNTIKGIRGEVYPAVSVEDGASLEAQFDGESGFAYPPPAGFSGVMASRRLM
mmetsp:Transcript_7750/g.17973  ORF Transcript_7750/g.17973 Transcript_7750/m.17973 type:complete len:184 (+) Transcript_7750:48-599(+)